jgi:hypothetical protein
VVKAVPEAPSAASLKGAARAGYDAARGMGVDFTTAGVKSWADDLVTKFEPGGFREANSPQTWGIINEFRNPPDGAVVDFNGLVAARKALSDIAGDFNKPVEQKWASAAIQSIDDLLENPRPGSVAPGVSELPEGFTGPGGVDPALEPGARARAAGEQYKDANANYAAAKRAEGLAGKQERAIDRAAINNSGQNLDNQLRQRIDEIINRPKEGRGYTDEEIAFLREVARGGVSENALRMLGNALGGGGGLGSIISSVVGAGAFGQPGAALPLLGYAAKRGSAAITNRKINRLSENTRKRSPLYRKMETDAPMIPSGDARKEALIRAMVLYDSSQPWLREQQQPPIATPAQARAIALRTGVY